MVLSINPSTFVITVPKVDMLQTQVTPIEIRELNLQTFRLALRDWEDDAGITFLKTHTHNTTVTISGVQLARVIEILEPYTITFEDGNYAVNLVGANSNVADKVNLNAVSVRAANSAGLIQTREIEYASFGGGVTINASTGTAGTDYPAGTKAYPVSNISDALFIANLRGFDRLFMDSSIEIDSGSNVSNFTLIGKSRTTTVITITDAVNCIDVLIKECNVVGVLDGGSQLESCNIGDISYVNGEIRNSGLYGTVYLDGNEEAVIANCRTIDQDNYPIIDMGGSGQDLVMTNYTGMIQIQNLTSTTEEVSIGLDAGEIILDSTISAGTIIVSGVGLLTNNTTGTSTVNRDGLINKVGISESVWDELTTNHTDTGSTGEALINAGIAGNPWNAIVADNLDAGTFGELIGKKQLTLAKWIALK